MRLPRCSRLPLGAGDEDRDPHADPPTDPSQAPAGAPGDELASVEATCHRLAGMAFPWDVTRALELALLKTFCVPSISGLLQRSGEFERRPRKRYDDTGLMVAELLKHGIDSPVGGAVIERMNRHRGTAGHARRAAGAQRTSGKGDLHLCRQQPAHR